MSAEPPPNPPRTGDRGFAKTPAFPEVSMPRTPRTPSFPKKVEKGEKRAGKLAPSTEIAGSPGSGGSPHDKPIRASRLARTPSSLEGGFAQLARGFAPSSTITKDNDMIEKPIPADLDDFEAYGLPAPYRQNSTWLMSSVTAAALSKARDSEGNLIWRESLIVGQPATLLGRPVEIDEGMPAPTAGNLPVAFGDYNAGYLINDRQGVRVLRDPYTNKPFVNFYSTKRVGGGLLDPNAIRLLKIPA